MVGCEFGIDREPFHHSRLDTIGSTLEFDMRASVRPLIGALAISGVVSAIPPSTAAVSAQMLPAPELRLAQAATTPAPPPAMKQLALTDKQIEGVLAAQKDMDAITGKLPDDAKPDPAVTAQLEAVAKKYGFANYDEYNDVIDNISLVLAGFDPASKKYVGSDAVIRAQIAQVQADKKMPAKDKTEALAELNDALKAPAPPIENKGNIDLVAKYYDKLADAIGNDEQ
jgi:hypothetical protein